MTQIDWENLARTRHAEIKVLDKELARLTRERDELRVMLGEWLRPYDGWSDAELSKRVDPATEKRIKESSATLQRTYADKETGG